jgi:hypothetical protein
MAGRTLAELLDTPEPAWPMVQEWIAAATNPVEVLSASDPQRGAALVLTQVTVRSPMGAVIYETGGLLIDRGWLRVLGSGHERLPRSLPAWNYATCWRDPDSAPPFLLVADDVLGGFFAVNGGGLGEARGKVYYFAPDAVAWEPTDLGYTDFLSWCLTGDLAKYYETFRWPGWEDEVSKLGGDQCLCITPPLWAEGPPVGQRHRGPIPVLEAYGMYVDDTGPP